MHKGAPGVSAWLSGCQISSHFLDGKEGEVKRVHAQSLLYYSLFIVQYYSLFIVQYMLAPHMHNAHTSNLKGK